MERTLIPWIALLLLASVDSAVPQTASRGERSALSKELEGLAPAPRIAYLRFLMKTKSGDPELHFQLGVAFQESEASDSAVFYYAKAASLDTTLSKAYVNWGVVLDEQRKSAEALAKFEKAAEVNQSDLLAHAHAAYLLFEAADYESARVHLARALSIDSLNPQPRFYLAIFFWESGLYREALAEWEKVVSLAPGSYLALKAEENITLLQQAMAGSGDERIPSPQR